MIKEYEDLLNESKQVAYTALINFLNNLGLDAELFNHLFNIPIKIDYDEENTNGNYAIYDANNNGEQIIYIGGDYIDDLYCNIEDGVDKNKVYANLASTIIHELLHANRDIILKQEINSFNLIDIVKGGKKLDTENKLSDEYDSLLVKMLTEPHILKLKPYVPVKIIGYDDNECTIVAFNKSTKKYEIFDHQHFITNWKSDIKNAFMNLSIELNLNKALHKPNQIIESKIYNKNINYINAAPNLYHGNISSIDFFDENIKSIGDLQDISVKTSCQITLEEGIIEALSNMIIMSRKDKFFDLENLCNKLTLSDISMDEKLAVKLLNCIGIENIKWFILSCYDDEYVDRFSQIFGSDYNSLLLSYSKIYAQNVNEEEYSQKDIDNVNDILNNRINNLVK